MVKTRAGKVISHEKQHYGRYAREASSLPGQKPNKRSKQRDLAWSEELNAWLERMRSLPHTPLISLRRRPRRTVQIIGCTHFGRNWTMMYPSFFFCHRCDIFEKEDQMNKRIMRDSQAFRCTGQHESWIFPTQRITKNVPRAAKK